MFSRAQAATKPTIARFGPSGRDASLSTVPPREFFDKLGGYENQGSYGREVSIKQDTGEMSNTDFDTPNGFPKGLQDNYLSRIAGGEQAMSTNHLPRWGKRSTWVSTTSIAALVNVTPV